MSDIPSAITLPIPDTCPGCNSAWEDGVCPRCGLSAEDIRGLLKKGCAAYENARASALAGDFRAARLHLAWVRACGINLLSEHPAVVRLSELCAEIPAAPADAAGAAVADAGREETPPRWLLPLAVGGSAFGVAAFAVALVALFIAIAALIVGIIAVTAVK